MSPGESPGARVLIVDDTPENLRLMSRLVRSFGWIAEAVSSGSEALRAASVQRPDIVVLDVNMPEMDGYDVCKSLKAIDGLEDTPVLFVSALDQPADKVAAFAAGGVDFVTKPFHALEVRVRMETQLELARLRSDLRRRSEELAVSLEQLRVLEKLRQDLVHMTAHDLRSPLTAVGGYLELLEDSDLSPELRDEFVRRARASVASAIRLLEAMLDLSRLEAGRMPLHPENCRLDLIAAEASRALGPLASARIDFSAVEPFVVVADRSLLHRILENIVANALKHGDDDDIIRLGTDAREGTARCWVENRGVTLSPECVAGLFQKWAAGAVAQGVRSTGLGLAFCKLAIEAQSGTIGYEPVPGGSRFWIEIPRATTG
ncbi:MAG: hybrid sensor histidine kinase/response regulator [Thermoanaerobaculia bacterium]